ncbi:carbamate kinase [Shewanella morhuae]|uniref:Carbamate kinase n=1 Tax=Shewanella morhuae TaxID=365591 RepID=A0ABX5HTT5_9GAMM|nr:carbamate kinase [Shewanella morhuae]PTA49527.1 carbamate kinase [Shewanella morhuae]SIQ59294.1 carbamate kinase [Shewanella morhuae]
MKIVLALGGNALLERGQPLTATNLRNNIKKAAASIAAIAREHDVVIVHGNGPQVGLLMEQNYEYQKINSAVTAYPLDVLGAETCGMIGYMLQQELFNSDNKLSITTILTQTCVDIDDVAFNDPTKFVGPIYSEEEIDKINIANPSAIFKKDGDYYRRVVSSPMPQDIVESKQISNLLENGNTVIACGGGGIPVFKANNGNLVGVECVVDKDLTAELLAEQIKADLFIILTDGAVYLNYGKENQQAIKHITPEELDKYHFPAGSMGPKIDAVCKFVSKGLGDAAIGALDELSAVIAGHSGTRITLGETVEYY